MLLSNSCMGVVNKTTFEENGMDTLYVLEFKNNFYEEGLFKVFHLSDHTGKSRDRIELHKNDSIMAVLELPIPNDEVKNLSVNEIKEEKDGFSFTVSWGGGKDYYLYTYFFIYDQNNFFLNRVIEEKMPVDNEDGYLKEKAMNPRIKISDFNLRQDIESR